MEGKSIISTIFPILLLISICAKPSLAAITSTEFIRSSCSATTYPALCYSSLSTHASAIQTSPKLLANTALTVTLSTTQSTSAMMTSLSKTHGLTPAEVAAMRDCIEVMRISVDEIQRSLNEMSNYKTPDFGLMINDVQTWVSAALTNEDTCTDGFARKSMNGELKTAVRARILNIAHLTSNALALINSYASLHG